MWNRLKRWLRKLQIRFAFWLLRRSIPQQPPKACSFPSPDLVGDGSDPCQLFIDAAASTLVQIEANQTALEELALLWVDQMDALEACRLEHPE